MLQYIPRFLSNTAGTCECGSFRRRENFDGNKETMAAWSSAKRPDFAFVQGITREMNNYEFDIYRCDQLFQYGLKYIALYIITLKYSDHFLTEIFMKYMILTT